VNAAPPTSKAAAGQRVDQVARWAFPLIYFAGLAVSYFYYVIRY
jgi:hypothetical protein